MRMERQGVGKPTVYREHLPKSLKQIALETSLARILVQTNRIARTAGTITHGFTQRGGCIDSLLIWNARYK